MATSARGAGAVRSSCQIQASMAAMAPRPQAKASATHSTVSSKKKAAVPAAASSGGQPSVGRRSSCTGRALRASVSRVSRPPKTVPGSQ